MAAGHSHSHLRLQCRVCETEALLHAKQSLVQCAQAVISAVPVAWAQGCTGTATTDHIHTQNEHPYLYLTMPRNGGVSQPCLAPQHCRVPLDRLTLSSDATGISSTAARSLLGEWAPNLLRELYERDVRRPYCPPALWLEPFTAAESAATQSAEERFSASAVMRALLQASSGSPLASPK